MERPLLAFPVQVCAGVGTWKCASSRSLEVTGYLEVFSWLTPSQEVRPQAVMALKLSYSSPARKRAVTGASSSGSWTGGRGRGVLKGLSPPRVLEMRLYAQEGFLEVATTVESNPEGPAGVSNRRVRDRPSAPRPMQNKEAPPALQCGRGGAGRVGRSVEAKSRRGFRACLYSKSNWEGFEGV